MTFKTVICLALISKCCIATEYTNKQFYTRLNESKPSTITVVDSEYKVSLFSFGEYNRALFLQGKISPDLNHFGKEYKTNVFTTLGFDF